MLRFLANYFGQSLQAALHPNLPNLLADRYSVIYLPFYTKKNKALFGHFYTKSFFSWSDIEANKNHKNT